MQRTEKLSGGAQGLICSWAGIVPRYHHGTWEERVAEEGLVVWSKGWGGHHCKALIESERRMKDAKAKQRNTREYRGPQREGRIWPCLERGLQRAGDVPRGDRLRDGGLGDPGPCSCCTCQADEVGEMHRLHNPRLHLDVEEGSSR